MGWVHDAFSRVRKSIYSVALGSVVIGGASIGLFFVSSSAVEVCPIFLNSFPLEGGGRTHTHTKFTFHNTHTHIHTYKVTSSHSLNLPDTHAQREGPQTTIATRREVFPSADRCHPRDKEVRHSSHKRSCGYKEHKEGYGRNASLKNRRVCEESEERQCQAEGCWVRQRRKGESINP